MSKLGRQLEEDRALRDSAREIFHNELTHVRRETRPGAIGERIANRIGRKAEGASDAAMDFAGSHSRTIAAAVIAAVAGAGLWIARGPIADGLAGLLGNRDEDAGDDGAEAEEDQHE